MRSEEILQIVFQVHDTLSQAPIQEQLFIAAMVECYSHNKSKVVSDSFIAKNHLEHKREKFTPLCPPPSCCTTAGLLDGKILCAAGGLGKPACDTTTCTWSFDCTHPKILDHTTIMNTPVAKPVATASVPVAQVVAQALATDTSSFSGDSSSTSSSAVNALIGLSVVAAILVVVVLVLAIMLVRKNQYVRMDDKP